MKKAEGNGKNMLGNDRKKRKKIYIDPSSDRLGRTSAGTPGTRNVRWRKKRSQWYKNRAVLIGASAVLAVGVLAAAVRVVTHSVGSRSANAAGAPLKETMAELPAEATTVNGISLDGLDFEQAVKKITAAYPWKLQVKCGDKTYEISNLVEARTRQLLEGICLNKKGGTYTFDFTEMNEDMKALIADALKEIAEKTDVAVENNSLDHFDDQTGQFVFSDGTPGKKLNQEELQKAVQEAMQAGEYEKMLTGTVETVYPDGQEATKKQYKTLASFTTETTANPKRNTNVKLAAQALNGTIVRPGQEFSFNKTIGERTAERGYQEAAAYNSGEVVQEIGGGVCQISSTLYRVAFRAGMEITYRRSHTFEPNYVTPGQDATISWDVPDFRFVNTSKRALGIRASYSDRKATVSIYGVSPLEEGVSWDLYSEKTKDFDLPEPQYVEDPTLAPGTQKTVSAGTQGSTWVTYKIVYKDGKEVERIKDHEKTYKGHTPVIHRNTGTKKVTTGETKAVTKPTAAAVDGMPDGYVPGKKVPSDANSASGTGNTGGAGTNGSTGSGSGTAGNNNGTAGSSGNTGSGTAAPAETAAPPAPTEAPASGTPGTSDNSGNGDSAAGGASENDGASGPAA